MDLMELEWECFKKSTSTNTSFPDVCGVYVIFEFKETNSTARYVGRYVGKGNIKDRIQAHEGSGEENLKLKDLMRERTQSCWVACAQIDNDKDMADVEFTLFAHYVETNTLYNEKAPPGERIPINLPDCLYF